MSRSRFKAVNSALRRGGDQRIPLKVTDLSVDTRVAVWSTVSRGSDNAPLLCTSVRDLLNTLGIPVSEADNRIKFMHQEYLGSTPKHGATIPMEWDFGS